MTDSADLVQSTHAGVLSKLSADFLVTIGDQKNEIERLTRERDELRAAIFGSDQYYHGLGHGNFIEMARSTEAARLGAKARAEAAESRALSIEAACAPLLVEAARWENWKRVYDVPDHEMKASKASMTAFDVLAIATAIRASAQNQTTPSDREADRG